jgi:hypothetical protein
MSIRRIACIASLILASISLGSAPSLAAAPDVGYRVSMADPTDPVAVEVSPWVWEPEASDSLRIAVGTRTRRIVIRVWSRAGHRHGRLMEQERAAVRLPWTTVARVRLSVADLAGGSTDPDRTRYRRDGFLAFDAATLGVEDHGGLAYSVVASAGQRLILRFGARDARTHHWTGTRRPAPCRRSASGVGEPRRAKQRSTCIRATRSAAPGRALRAARGRRPWTCRHPRDRAVDPRARSGSRREPWPRP